jgi:hypothetical protein
MYMSRSRIKVRYRGKVNVELANEDVIWWVGADMFPDVSCRKTA